MRIYIVEDDISVINILEDIIENYDLGEICGDCGGDVPDISHILRCQPDVVLVDFLMPLWTAFSLFQKSKSTTAISSSL